MPVIAAKGSRPYGIRMAAAFLRLLALAAFVLMPFSMTSANATPMPADHLAMAMGAGHCDEQPAQEKAPASKMDCAAMCSALPAADVWAPLPVLKPSAPPALVLAAPFSGIEPEIATPPPRLG